ncbi:protein phosphatase 1 regulatory subunit 12C [Lonchura striata]
MTSPPRAAAVAMATPPPALPAPPPRGPAPAMAAAAAAAAAAARERRREQLRRWEEAAAAAPGPGRARPGPARVRFERQAEFRAACAGAELAEARAMVMAPEGGGRALLGGANADGVSALHQACIDENMEVVQFLVESGADVNQADNEGWTPLHVAAACGCRHIAQYLLEHGADAAALTCDLELPLEVAEDEALEELLRAELRSRGVDVADAKRAEEQRLLRDTRLWLASGRARDRPLAGAGASALHVAAAKGYIEVMRLLLAAGCDPDVRDEDGWTPLHAAAHWGEREACRLLCEHLCDMSPQNNVGQRPCDLADEETLPLLEELQRRQLHLRSQKDPGAPPPPPEPEGAPPPPGGGKQRRPAASRRSRRERRRLRARVGEGPPPPLRPPGGGGAPDSDEGGRARGRGRGRGFPPNPLFSQNPRFSPQPRRPFQPPARDEESESQRKARSRLMRQARRATQGVTLPELRAAEHGIGRGAEGRGQQQPIRDQEGREPNGSESDGPEDAPPPPSPAPAPPFDYQQLFQELWVENERIREQLQEAELALTQSRLELERVTQRQERSAERPARLELERFERRALELKAAELEEELKALSDLRADNQRLKDENAALIRVISKLSK